VEEKIKTVKNKFGFTNLSNITFTEQEMLVLSKGQNFSNTNYIIFSKRVREKKKAVYQALQGNQFSKILIPSLRKLINKEIVDLERILQMRKITAPSFPFKLSEVEAKYNIKLIIADKGLGVVAISKGVYLELYEKMLSQQQYIQSTDMAWQGKMKGAIRKLETEARSSNLFANFPSLALELSKLNRNTCSIAKPIIKLHKNPKVFRPIISSFKTGKRIFAQIVAVYMGDILQYCLRLSDNSIINNVTNVINILNNIIFSDLQSKVYIFTADIKDYYNALHYDSILEAIKGCFKWLPNNIQFQYRVKFQFCIKYYENFALLSPMKALNRIFLTRQGLCMGDADAPATAQLVRFYYERKAKLARWYPKSNLSIFGYLDDLLIIVKENDILTTPSFIQSYLNKIYPDYLKFEISFRSSFKYLDLRIECLNNSSLIKQWNTNGISNVSNPKYNWLIEDNKCMYSRCGRIVFYPEMKPEVRQRYINPLSNGSIHWYLNTIKMMSDRASGYSSHEAAFLDTWKIYMDEFLLCGYPKWSIPVFQEYWYLKQMLQLREKQKKPKINFSEFISVKMKWNNINSINTVKKCFERINKMLPVKLIPSFQANRSLYQEIRSSQDPKE